MKGDPGVPGQKGDPGEKGDPMTATTRTVVLDAAGWNADTKQLAAAVESVTTANTVIIAPAPASIVAYGKCGVYAAAQEEGRLTFACAKQPEESLTVNVLII